VLRSLGIGPAPAAARGGGGDDPRRAGSDASERERALDRARREAETFVEVQQDLAETLDLIPVLQKIARHARLLCHSDLAYIAPFDPRAGVARVVALLGERTAALRNVRIEPGRGLAGRVLESRRPYHTARLLEDERLGDVHLDPVTAEGVVAALAVPMILEQELIGLIYVANRTPQPFADHDEDILLRLAVPAALAIRSARLVTELAQERDLLAVRSRELDRAGAQLRGIVEAASDGILTVDAGGRITSANPAAEGLFAYPAHDLVGRSLHSLLPDPADGADPLPAATSGGGGGGRQELSAVRRDGSRFPVELSVSVVRTAQDHFFAVVVRDITERKAIERMKDEFIGTVSHELRTPLTAIRGHLELVLEGDAGPIGPLQREFLGIAAQSTERLGALINDLLDVERLEAGKMAMRREPVDLGAVLREVASTFRLTAERKGLVFREAIADGLAVVGDRDRLIQVFANLVANAIKYTPRGEVGLTASPEDGQAAIVVHDTGIGMPAEEQRQLFTRFFRSQHPLVREAGGTGLGLVIARAIVEGHGGRITVESRPEAGSRFAVRLPAAG
jgi:PAS domain S-box-containing protein